LEVWTISARPCRRLTLRSATEFSQRENFHHSGAASGIVSATLKKLRLCIFFRFA
jgi:hypothetical protein